MSKQPWMPLFVDAFVADTMHLSAAEIGAYALLLMAMWRHNGSVPDDDKDLARITRSGKAWKKMKARLAPMLIFENGYVTQKRLRKEWDYVTTLGKKNSENAKARWSKNNDITDATASISHMPDACPHTHTHTQTRKKEYTGGKPPVKDELLLVVDEERAEAVIEHRKRLGSPLTARAARQLAKAFAQAPDPNAAADEMLARGWRGFKLEWMDRGGRAPPGRGETLIETAKRIEREIEEEYGGNVIDLTAGRETVRHGSGFEVRQLPSGQLPSLSAAGGSRTICEDYD